MEAESVNAPCPISSAAAFPTGESLSYKPSEPFVVFRNGISLSASRGTTPEPAGPDFFSLDVGVDAQEALVFTPTLSHRAVEEEPERTLEGGWFRGNCRIKSPMLQLHKEILDFCDFLSPTPEERELRHLAVVRVFDVVRHIWPSSKGEVFGSFRTGLYLPSSDIDVVILGSEIRTQHGLHALSRALSQKGIAKNMKVIAKARIPIIKFVETRSEISFDISFNVENGPKAADFIKDAIARWPPLRPLCLILKVFLQQRDLNEVYTGGIGSYALLTMLIAMLRDLSQHQPREQNLGVLLVHFFDFYGCKLNISEVGVSCSESGTFFNKSSKGFSCIGLPFSLCLEDPQAPENDIGKNSFNFFQVRSEFSMAFSTITNIKTIMGLGSSKSILGTIIRPDTALLERKGGPNGDMTFEEILPGAGNPLLPYQFDSAQHGISDEEGPFMPYQYDISDEDDPFPRGKLDSKNGSASRSSSSGERRKTKIRRL